MTYKVYGECLSNGITIKDKVNSERHGISFEEASELFESGDDYLEIYDEEHSDDEERFIGIGPIRAGIVVIIYAERSDDVVRLINARCATKRAAQLFHQYVEGNS